MYFNHYMIKENKAGWKNVARVRRDDKKANDIPAQSWTLLNVQDIEQEHKIHQVSHEKLYCRINSRRKTLAEVKIQRGIFKRDVLWHKYLE